MRTPKEALIDRVLLLYAIDKVNEYGIMEGPFKLMKVPFLSQCAMNGHGEKGFNYTFFKWDYGPLSTEIYDDRDALLRAGYIAQLGPKGRVYPTENGKRLLESLRDLFNQNHRIMQKIDREAKRSANLSFSALKNLVYGIKVRHEGKNVPVEELPRGAQVIGKIEQGEAKVVFELDEDWLDSIYAIIDETAEDRAKLAVINRAS